MDYYLRIGDSVVVAALGGHHGDERAVLVDDGRARQVLVVRLEGGRGAPLRQLPVARHQQHALHAVHEHLRTRLRMRVWR